MSSLKFRQMDIAADKLTLNPENLRFRGGAMHEGIRVADNYNLSTMKDVIKSEGGVPGRLVVEEVTDDKGVKSFIVLAGNRRTAAVQEMLNDKSLSAELLERLKTLPCNVYKDLTDKQKRDLVNDQRSQKYNRSELDVYIWKLQFAGMSFADIAMFVYPQMATYAAGGAKKMVDIDKCTTEEERKKEVTVWLKGTLDTIILTCGKLGPRVRKALLLTDMEIDGVSPPVLDDKGEPVLDDKGNVKLEKPEFRPSQGRCNELRKAAKTDPNWTPENGGDQFNALIAKYVRQDAGLDPNGEPIKGGPTRATAEMLVEQLGRTNSIIGKTALRYARGEMPKEFADVDAEAFRLQQLVAKLVELRSGVKNEVLAEFITIILTKDVLTLTSFLAKHS